ncbi:MBL fold metallo-hydrolase [Novosphingobium sp. BL-52-GroH]|uniref:MBL fold metallo-hydrolase n=1 Tax=Novosphingobium sp. BL-52-GroH TaxID=3349877 RepID=UPI00384D921D
MANWPFTQGIHEIGNGLYGYVQPDGTWGWSNAGLIESDGRTLLVDTLMSVALTREMLDTFRARVPAAARIDQLVNTHANPDHFFGNQLLKDSEIIATATTAHDMAGFDPKLLSGLRDNYRNMGDAGEFLYETMGRKFDFSEVEVTVPNRTFEESLTLQVGSKEVRLVEVGPAHTASDILVHVPGDRTVFTGDILFNEGTPIMWAGPIGNWIAACDHIDGLDVDLVVPGHGPITDKTAVRNLKAYFEYIRDEARVRYDAGVGWEEAARDINLREFRGWSDPERIVANVFSLYRQFGAAFTPEDGRDLFGAMGRYHKAICNRGEACGHAH